MRAFDLSRLAKEDLKIIARFTEKHWGREQRFLYIKQFDNVFCSLAINPLLGKKCNYITNTFANFGSETKMKSQCLQQIDFARIY